MEKLELKNKEILEIQDGASENSIQIEVENLEDFTEIYEKFTDENLSEIKIYNENDALCTILKDKTLVKVSIQEVEEKLIVTFNLKDVDITMKKIKHLEDTVDVLVMASLGVGE